MYFSGHKGSKSGPVPLTMSENLKSYSDVFISNVRDDFAKEGVEVILTTDSGRAFKPGMIGKRIAQWWEKATGMKKVYK